MARIGARKNNTVRKVSIVELAATKYQVASLAGSSFLGCLIAMTAEIKATNPKKMLLKIVNETMWCQCSILTPPKAPLASWAAPAVVPASRRVARPPKIRVEITAMSMVTKMNRLIVMKILRFLFILQ